MVELLFYVFFLSDFGLENLSNVTALHSFYLNKTKERYTKEISILYEKKYAVDSPEFSLDTVSSSCEDDYTLFQNNPNE